MSPYVLSILRIVVAFLFMAHGSQKLFGYPPSGKIFSIEMFSLLWIAGVLELFGGFFVLAGLFTRPISFILSGEMAVAFFKAHASRGVWPILNGGELAVLYCFIFLFYSVAGGGAWSLDALRKKIN